MTDDDYPTVELTAHCVEKMAEHIDQLVKEFGISKADAANEWLLAVIAFGYELSTQEPLQAQPLKMILRKYVPANAVEDKCDIH